VIESGPYINLRVQGKRVQYSTVEMDDYTRNWKLTNLDYKIENGITVIKTTGVYDSISAGFTIQFDENGLFKMGYKANNIPEGRIMQEAGLRFNVTDNFKKLAWDRDAYFSTYPAGNMGSATGEVDLTAKSVMNYREKPLHAWEMDSKGFYYFGIEHESPYPNIVRGMKESIYSYVLKTEKSRIEVISDGMQACRFDKIDGENRLMINDHWDYSSLLWGNYMKLVQTNNTLEGEVVMSLK
jgi:hypothetical protein